MHIFIFVVYRIYRMSKLLAMQSVKPDGYSYNGDAVYKMGPSVMKEYVHPVVKDSVSASVSGASSDCTIKFTDPNEQGILTDLRFQMSAGSGGASTCAFPNPWLIFDNLELFDDGVSVDKIRNQDEIRLRLNMYLRAMQNQLWVENQKNVGGTPSASWNQLSISTAATVVDLSLMPLFYGSLMNRPTTSFGELRVQYTFAVDGGTTATTGSFCVAGSATNEYPLLSYSSIKIRSVVMRPTDKRIMPAGNYVQVIDKFHTIIKNGAFNTADTDYFSIKLNSDFPITNSCKGIFIWAESPDLRTAYNDAQNAQIVSIPESLCVEVRLNSNVLFSHKLSASDLIKRRRYIHDVQMRNFSVPFEASVLASGNDVNEYVVILTYIDFTNLELHESHWDVLSGIPSTTVIEVDVHCGTSGVDADNTNLHAGLHYIETVTKKDRLAVINRNPAV